VVLGFIFSNECARLLLFYCIIFVSPRTTIKIIEYCDIGNGSKILQYAASIVI
jgi:hypothetical protein